MFCLGLAELLQSGQESGSPVQLQHAHLQECLQRHHCQACVVCQQRLETKEYMGLENHLYTTITQGVSNFAQHINSSLDPAVKTLATNTVQSTLCKQKTKMYQHHLPQHLLLKAARPGAV